MCFCENTRKLFKYSPGSLKFGFKIKALFLQIFAKTD